MPKLVPRLLTGNDRKFELTALDTPNCVAEKECFPVGRLTESDATARSRPTVYSSRSCVSVSPVKSTLEPAESVIWLCARCVVRSSDICRPSGATTTRGRLHWEALWTTNPCAKPYRWNSKPERAFHLL